MEEKIMGYTRVSPTSGKMRHYHGDPKPAAPQQPEPIKRTPAQISSQQHKEAAARLIESARRKSAERRQVLTKQTDEKLAREKTFLGRMGNRRDDAKESIGRFGNKITNFKNRAIGGIAAVGKSAKDKAEAAKEVARKVGRGAQAVGKTGLAIGKGVYGVGRDLAHLGVAAAHGVANSYRAARKAYKITRDGVNAATDAYNYMTGDASPEEKAKAVFNVAGKGASMAGKALWAGAKVGGRAAKGVYDASVSKEHRDQIAGYANQAKKGYDYMTGSAPRSEKAAEAAKVLGKGAVGATKLAGKGLWEGAKLGGRAVRGTYNWLRGK
jgi:hypothetical protein